MKKLKKNKSNNAAELNWTLEDYQNNNEEAPERIKKNPRKTEGELMSDQEIEDWFAESIQVLKILKEENPKIFLKIHEGFVEDTEYLYSIERVDKDVLVYAKDLNNYDF